MAVVRHAYFDSHIYRLEAHYTQPHQLRPNQTPVYTFVGRGSRAIVKAKERRSSPGNLYLHSNAFRMGWLVFSTCPGCSRKIGCGCAILDYAKMQLTSCVLTAVPFRARITFIERPTLVTTLVIVRFLRCELIALI